MYSLADGVEVDGDACAVVLTGGRLVVRLAHVCLGHCGNMTHTHTHDCTMSTLLATAH